MALPVIRAKKSPNMEEPTAMKGDSIWNGLKDCHILSGIASTTWYGFPSTVGKSYTAREGIWW
jgi:hypothetical protein